MGIIHCPETSVQTDHSALCNIPEECRSHLHHGRSLKSHITLTCFGINMPSSGSTHAKPNTLHTGHDESRDLNPMHHIRATTKVVFEQCVLY
jgi:hypothetical protein